MTRSRTRHLVTIPALVAALAFIAGAPSVAGIFRVNEPELAFKAQTRDLMPGVHLVSTPEQLEELAALLDPVPETPDLTESTLVIIVGDDRDNDCRGTVLEEVGTRFRTAKVTLKEFRPGPTCRCTVQEPVRAVFGVLVAGTAKKAQLDILEVETDCGAAGRRPAGTTAAVEEILSGTLVEGEPGSRLLTSDADWRAVCASANQADSCAAVDFARSKVVIVVGQALENACRRTRSDGLTLDGSAARVALREIHPGPDRMCAQVFGGYQVYAFRVPASVQAVEVDSHVVR